MTDNDRTSLTPIADERGLDFGKHPYEQDAEATVKALSDYKLRGLTVELASHKQMHRGAVVGMISIAIACIAVAFAVFPGVVETVVLVRVGIGALGVALLFLCLGQFYVVADPDRARRAWVAFLDMEREARAEEAALRSRGRAKWFRSCRERRRASRLQGKRSRAR